MYDLYVQWRRDCVVVFGFCLSSSSSSIRDQIAVSSASPRTATAYTVTCLQERERFDSASPSHQRPHTHSWDLSEEKTRGNAPGGINNSITGQDLLHPALFCSVLWVYSTVLGLAASSTIFLRCERSFVALNASTNDSPWIAKLCEVFLVLLFMSWYIRRLFSQDKLLVYCMNRTTRKTTQDLARQFSGYRWSNQWGQRRKIVHDAAKPSRPVDPNRTDQAKACQHAQIFTSTFKSKSIFGTIPSTLLHTRP